MLKRGTCTKKKNPIMGILKCKDTFTLENSHGHERFYLASTGQSYINTHTLSKINNILY